MIDCSKEKAAVLFSVVARLLLELCRNDPGFYVTKRVRGKESYQLSCVLLAASSGHRIYVT